MTSNKRCFTCFSGQRETVHLADGRKLLSLGFGTAIIRSQSADGEIISVKMKEVLYVPNLRSNLISVGLIASSGYQIEFGAKQCQIKKDGEVMLIGNRTNSVYWTAE